MNPMLKKKLVRIRNYLSEHPDEIVAGSIEDPYVGSFSNEASNNAKI